MLSCLLLGARGQVGTELLPALRTLGPVHAPDRDVADLRDPEGLRAVVRRLAPDVIVNAAAYTLVDRAEDEPDIADAVNATAPGVLAEEAARLGSLLVHYSTDYVFDGTKAAPYVETDPVRPLSVYGRSKASGEQAIVAIGGRHLILRTSWVFSSNGANFVRTILRLAAERDELRVVADQVGAPTSARLIARVTTEVLRMGVPHAAEGGIHHLAAAGEVSWHGLARYVVDGATRRGLSPRAGARYIIPIATSEYPTRARRPANSLLDTGRIRRTFGVALPVWTEGVDEVLDALFPPE